MVSLEHVLVPANDREAAARFLADLLGVEYLGLGSTAGPPAFARIRVGPTTLDFANTDGFEPHHYAFRVDDEEFDAVLARVQSAGLTFYARWRSGELAHGPLGRRLSDC